MLTAQPLLRALQWLSVLVRRPEKLSTICHNFFSDSSPAGLSDLLTVTPLPNSCVLLPQTHGCFIAPHVKAKPSGQRTFSCCAAQQWNQLSHRTAVVFNAAVLQNCVKSSLSFFLPPPPPAASPPPLSHAPPPHSPLTAFMCARHCMCVGVSVCVHTLRAGVM